MTTKEIEAIFILVGWSGLQSAAAYFGFAWAMKRSNMMFYSIFVGDALLRLMVLGMAVLVLSLMHMPLAAPLISLALAYLVFSLIQIPFLHRLPL